MGANKGKLLFTLIAVLAIAAIGAGAMSLAGSSRSDSPATSVDVSGNCDEAEHANDPECAILGGTAPAPTATASPEDRASDDPNDDVQAREPGEDISGPCDEAEHANDPRCTGTQVADRRGDDRDDDDRSGPDDSSGGDSDDSDRSGSNSGRG